MKTKSKVLSKQQETEMKIQEMLGKGKLRKEDIKLFEDDQLKHLGPFFTKKLNELKGDAFDDFYDKIEAIVPHDTKNQLWERTHNNIVSAISTFMQDNGRMPSPFEIANKAELSVYSVKKHLKDYSKDDRYLNTIHRFEFMTSKVLAKVFKFAVNGDMRAAKLYFDVVGSLSGNSISNTLVNTQNNYIQINQLKLSQEIIQQLNEDQLGQIESVLKNVVPKISEKAK
jgi:hypothetical protein